MTPWEYFQFFDPGSFFLTMGIRMLIILGIWALGQLGIKLIWKRNYPV